MHLCMPRFAAVVQEKVSPCQARTTGTVLIQHLPETYLTFTHSIHNRSFLLFSNPFKWFPSPLTSLGFCMAYHRMHLLRFGYHRGPGRFQGTTPSLLHLLHFPCFHLLLHSPPTRFFIRHSLFDTCFTTSMILTVSTPLQQSTQQQELDSEHFLPAPGK